MEAHWNGAGEEPRRDCRDCVCLFRYSRSERDVMGIAEFAERRASVPTFACFDPATNRCFSLPRLTQGKSYYQVWERERQRTVCQIYCGNTIIALKCINSSAYPHMQHYGPHSTADYRMAACGSFLLACGGLRQGAEVISREVLRFDTERTACWEGVYSSSHGSPPGALLHLHKDLTEFGLVVRGGGSGGEEVMVFGGLSDDYAADRTHFRGRTVNVSREVAAADLASFSSSSGKSEWRLLSPMPLPRAGFSTQRVDDLVCLVGDGFCDVYDVLRDSWSVLSGVPRGFGPRPALAALGCHLYVFGSRPDGASGGGEVQPESNVFRRLDLTSGTWAPVPQIPFESSASSRSKPLRQDVISAFAHNGLVYLFGWQVGEKKKKRYPQASLPPSINIVSSMPILQAACENCIHVYDPESDCWTVCVRHLRGRLLDAGAPGVLLRRQRVRSEMLAGGDDLPRTRPD